MKLLIYSDLHLEWSDFSPDRAAVEQADVVVLAGDIHVAGKGVPWAQKTFQGKPVVYAGNHEFYGEKRPEQIALMATQSAQSAQSATAGKAGSSAVHFLDNDAVEIAGVWFLGATLWTDYELHAGPQETAPMLAISRQLAMGHAQHFLNDHKSIRETTGRHGKFRPSQAYDLHLASRTWLAERLRALRERVAGKPRVVVVTHHAPAAQSLGGWMDDGLSPAYASRLPSSAFEGVDLWIHGHIHESQDYRHHGSRVVANPRGYPKAPRLGRRVNGGDGDGASDGASDGINGGTNDGGHDNPDFKHLLVEI